ncbi:hypothetical protein DL1_03170 [Thioclava dalianensis]|uniref:Uncharacterized protein n=1 Tax=Thioclava dalianensis TaxID=1185766 RepID=A0A074TD37_9RHOB|nr:hypothetical protein [Thioclava dalianensis]KEP69614.1 hypothetical protein DL1_03170 [Thioclava dalianensis]
MSGAPSAPATRPAAQRAGILCNDPQFQRFAAIRCGFPGHSFQASAAAEYLRTCCKVTSRRELDWNRDAQDRFERLCTEFDAWAGRIFNQR